MGGTWELATALERVDSKLLVGNGTSVQPLAKAVAARAKELPEGKSLIVETSVSGQAEPTRLRVSKLANSVSRAYGWQVNPNDTSRPVRSFRCISSLIDD